MGHSCRHPALRRLAALALGSSLLAACGEHAAQSTSVVGAGPHAGEHLAALGALAGAKVKVTSIDHPSRPYAIATTDAKGRFKLQYDPSAGNKDEEWLVVTVDGGQDIDANDDGVADATPTPNLGTIHTLVLGKRLRENSISVTVLSDVMYHELEVVLPELPPEAIQHQLDEMASAMVKDDIDGDGALSYEDINAFNPARSSDRPKLTFDYGLIFAPQDLDGTSLADKYHRNNQALLQEAFEAAFTGLIATGAPTLAELPQVAHTIKSEDGGMVTSPELGSEMITNGNEEIIHRVDRGSAPMVLTATPDTGWKFSRWIGCPQVQADKTCLAISDDSQMITAQFVHERNILNPGFTQDLALEPTQGQLGLVFVGTDQLLLTASADDAASVARIDSVLANGLIHTGLLSRPELKVTGIVSRSLIGGGAFYQARFTVVDVNLFEAYKTFSVSSPDEPVTVDELTMVSYGDVVPGDDHGLVEVPSPINQGYVAGPSPAGIGAQGSCPTPGDEEVYTDQLDGAGQPARACLVDGTHPVQLASDCMGGDQPLQLLDGRVYCVAGGSAMASARVAASTSTRGGASSVMRVGASRSEAAYFERRVAKARAAGEKAASRRANTVFLVGYGKAVDLGNGIFLTNNPSGKGMSLLQTDGNALTTTSYKAAMQAMKQTCASNTNAAGCGFAAAAASGPGTDLFPQPLEFDLSKPGSLLRVTIKVQVNIESRATGNLNYEVPTRIEIASSGFVTVQPTIGLEVGLGGSGSFEGKVWKPAAKTNPANVSKTLLTYDFAKNVVPAGAVVSGEVALVVGLDVTGAITVTMEAKLPMTLRWDAEVRAGSACTYVVYGCDNKESRFDFTVKADVKYAATLSGQMNAVIEPYLEIQATSGVRGAADKMMKVALRGYLQGEVVVNGPTIRLTNIPAELSKQENKPLCIDYGSGVALNAYYGVRAYGEISTRDQPIDLIYSYTKTLSFPLIHERFASLGWDVINSDGALTPEKREDSGFNPAGITDTPPCTGGAKTEAATREFKPGKLEMRDDSFFVTANRKFIMQKDGNLVLYVHDGGTGKTAGAIWASGTQDKLNTRLVYQQDGNLVIYNLREQPVWASGTNGYPASTLRITSDGDVLMFRNASGSRGEIPIWGRVLNENAGNFVMYQDESIQTFDRRLKMQTDGNLVLYKFDRFANQNREALWASNTSGNNGAQAVFQPDGRLTVVAPNGSVIWSSNTAGTPNGVLRLQSDGNLVIYTDGERAVWATGTNGR